MKILSSEIFHAALLLIILGYCGLILYREEVGIRGRIVGLEQLASGNDTTPLVDTAGIDIYGKKTADRTGSGIREVVFLLRNSSLTNDLEFWNSVHSQIAQHHNLELIGYCDSSQCGDDVKRAGAPPFSVIAGGNARDIQSVVNADVNGQAYILEPGKPSFTKVEWRVPGNMVQKVVEEITK
jgi:hypothetical protein